MKIVAYFLSLIVLCSSLNCPVQQRFRSSIFSGILIAQPEANKISQQMLYTQNFDTALVQVPNVCLSICSYQDENAGYMKIFTTRQTVTQQSFVIKVKSPARSRWRKLHLNYLVSTKTEIQIGLVTANNPQYDNNGYISLNYSPKIRVTQQLKIRQFLLGIDIAAQNGAFLSINHEKTLVQPRRVVFIFSSKSCNIYSISISVVLFDPSAPGILFVDGAIQQNSLSTSTEIRIDKTYIEQMRINFVGFSAINAQDVQGISISVSFQRDFSLLLDSTDIKSVKVNYLIISLVDCGTCSGYPYLYNQVCYRSCPPRTTMKSNACIPVQCRNGYQYNSNNQCIPKCGLNSFYSGKTCSCVQGFNMIQGFCNKCPIGTSYNYLQMRCVQICGENSQFNQSDQRCYCYAGFVLVDNKCTTCPFGTVYDQINQACLNQALQCGPNEVIAFGRCVCQNNYYKINNICQQCPAYSSYNLALGYCQCNQGYRMGQNSCIGSCKQNQYPVGSDCQCNLGYTRNVFGICTQISCSQLQYLTSDGQCVCRVGYIKNALRQCVPISITCPPNEVLIDRSCLCIPGYSRNPDGLCYKIQCLVGQIIDISLGKCISSCSYGSNWDSTYRKCIPPCAGGYVYDFTYSSCVPSCQNNYRWNGSQCACTGNCQTFCPPGTYYNQIYKSCMSYQNCQSNQVWNGLTCVCADGFINYNGVCQQGCQPFAQFTNGRCACLSGYYERNGNCQVISCPPSTRWNPNSMNCQSYCDSNRIWGGNSCICPNGLIDYNGACISGNPCTNGNQYFNNGRCQCNQGFYRINGGCMQCPINTQWDSFRNQCVYSQPNCQNGKIWNGYTCQCPPGLSQTVFGSCARECGVNQVLAPNSQCICAPGLTRDRYGACTRTCDSGFNLINGNCIPIRCGQNQQYSLDGCVCVAGFERFNDLCLPVCGQYETRFGPTCQCLSGYQRQMDGSCQIPNNCNRPHIWRHGRCICSRGFQLNQQGQCVVICRPGFIRNNGLCTPPAPTPSCRPDQVFINGQCVCRPGTTNIFGVCSQCPQNSQLSSSGVCICLFNNSPVMPGRPCPSNSPSPFPPTPPIPFVPGSSCTDPNSYWDNQFNGCKCKNYFQWIYGGCRVPATCTQNQIWNGQQCICSYGFLKVGTVCQKVQQTYFCPPNSNFNGVNCQCNQGFYTFNMVECRQCPMNNYWDGRQCGSSMGSCSNGYNWDHRKRRCHRFRNRCTQNQYWDGANCRCNQGFFWIDGRCTQCPPNTVFDGKQCTRGQTDRRCYDPYSYWNGATCVCVPGYWLLQGTCVSCPSGYQWNGICCSVIPGLLRSVADSQFQDSIPVQIR